MAMRAPRDARRIEVYLLIPVRFSRVRHGLLPGRPTREGKGAIPNETVLG